VLKWLLGRSNLKYATLCDQDVLGLKVDILGVVEDQTASLNQDQS
jgi:hypothetical protein